MTDLNYVSGMPYLCEMHREQATHVISAVCPMCANIERSELIYNGLRIADDYEELGIRHGNLVEKFSRLLYITGQLTMLRDKEGDEYKKLHAEYIGMKFPEFEAKAEGGES